MKSTREHFNPADFRRRVLDAIGSGSGLDGQDPKNGNTLLHTAVAHRDMEDCVVKLLSAGANPNVLNANNESPYDIALDCGNQVNMQLLSRREEYKRQILQSSDLRSTLEVYHEESLLSTFLDATFDDYVSWSDTKRLFQLKVNPI